ILYSFNRDIDWYIPTLYVRADDGILFAFNSGSHEREKWLKQLRMLSDLAGTEAVQATGMLLKLGVSTIPLLVTAVLLFPLTGVRIGAASILRRLLEEPGIHVDVVRLIGPALKQESDPAVRREIARILTQPRISPDVELLLDQLKRDADPQIREIVSAAMVVQRIFAQ